MAFLAPLTLVALSLVALPIIIHLLVRRRAKRFDFPSLKFLRETPSFKLYPRKIRQPLLLALRIAAIIMLVLGLARPLFTLRARAPETVRFILMDASLSMKTRGRTEAAREQALSIVDKLSAGERASVIAFSSHATVLAELTADKSKLLEAIERYQPAGGVADYGVGLASVNVQLKQMPQVLAQADIISDFQLASFEGQNDSDAPDAASLRLVTHPVGSQIERNAFWIDETAEQSESGVELSASEILIDADGRRGARRTWTLEGSEGARADIEWRTQSNGQITGRIKNLEPDDFDSDDERFFAFSLPRESRVLLMEDGGEASTFLRAALEAAGEIKLDRQRELPTTSTELDSYSLIVHTLDGAARDREASALIEYARAGGVVWLCLSRNLDTASWNALSSSEQGSELPFESITRVSERTLNFGLADMDAPVLSAFNEGELDALRAVRIRAGYKLAPRERVETLMRWNNGEPAFVSARIGGGQIMLLATSPERAASDLGSSPIFPVLASSILNASVRKHQPLSLVIGEAVHLGLAPTADVKITKTEGRVGTAKARELISQPLRYFSEPGIYKVEFAGGEKFLAFNAPAIESERSLATANYLEQYFTAKKAEKVETVNARALNDAMERNGQTWRYFLIAAFLLTLAELLIAMRGRINREQL